MPRPPPLFSAQATKPNRKALLIFVFLSLKKKLREEKGGRV